MKTRLEQERLAASLSQEQLAARAGVSQSTVSKLETNQIPSPSFRNLARLAAALRRCGCDVDAADLQPGAVRLVTEATGSRRLGTTGKGKRRPKTKSHPTDDDPVKAS